MKPALLRSIVFACSVAVAVSAGASEHESRFVKLFNGNNLEGWTQKGGEAKYTIEDGVIVGTSVPKTPNSFLCTEKMYTDFVLELEFKVDPKLNSGVQIRSNCYDEDVTYTYKNDEGETQTKKVNAGRVHGYQVEIDPSDRAWSAGIYDEGRRGWLNNLAGEENKLAREAFKQNEWNHYRIKAVGPVIKTWINGVPAADLHDDMTDEGFIALQVHGVGDNEEKIGAQVKWRNIKLMDLSVE